MSEPTVREAFPNEPGPEPTPLIPAPRLPPAEFLRAAGWRQSYFPEPHRIREERVWTHPDEPWRGALTFHLALMAAGYDRGWRRGGSKPSARAGLRRGEWPAKRSHI